MKLQNNNRFSGKSTFAALLAACLLLTGAMAGCSSSSSSSSSSAGSSSSGAQASGSPSSQGSSASGSAAPGGFHETGYPIVDETVTLKMIANTHTATDEYNDIKTFQELEARTNVHIEWELVRSGWDEKKSLLLASGDLPDAFFGAGLSDSDIVSNADYFVSMEGYIDQYCPNIKAMFDKEPEVKGLVTDADGKIYSLPKTMPLRPVTYDVGMINNNWLQTLNLSLPETTDDFYNVLKAFKEQDPNGNGANDEIPMSFNGVSTGIDSMRSLFGAFGVVDDLTGDLISLTDGKVEFVPVMDGYKEGISYFHKLYAEGLIDPEAFTHDFAGYKAKLQNADTAIVGTAFHWSLDGGLGLDRSKEYTQLMPLKGPEGHQYWRSNAAFVRSGRNCFELTTANQYPEVTMRWVDTLYEEEVSLQLYYGAFGVGLEKTSDGKYEILPPADPELTPDMWQWKNGCNDRAPQYVSRETEALVIPSDSVKLKLANDEAYAPFLKKEVYPMVIWSREQSEELAVLKTDIYKLCNEQMANWITNGGVEEEWESYKAQLNKMGLERMIEIFQKGYDDYMANMK